MFLAKALHLLAACTLALFALGANARAMDDLQAQNTPLEKIELLPLDDPRAWLAQAVELPQENDCRYDGHASDGLLGGLNRYQYAESNPLKYTDPLGLFGMADMPTAPQGVVDFGAGLGDALLLGTGSYLRDAAGVDGGVDECSDAYLYGGLSSAAFGGARLAYAGLAKAGSVVATSGAAASEFRQTLKVVFRGGVGRNWRPPNLTGKSDAALRQSAGKTNAAINSYGAGTAAAAGIGASKCGCPR